MNFKHLLSIILVFVLSFGICSVALADENAEIPEGYTPIYTAEDLNNIRNNLSGKYILMNDIDLSVYENWEPIGTSDTPFTGELDGNGYSLFNLTIKGEYDSGDTLYFALFNTVKSSIFSDLSIINADIDVKYTGTTVQTSRAGVIAGYSNGATVENCIVSGKIKTDGFFKSAVGGFFGKDNSITATNCVSYTNIIVLNPVNPVNISVGGISGISTNGTLSQDCNYGNISVSGTDIAASHRCVYAGGIVGESDGNSFTVKNCYNRGNISLNFSGPSVYAGGIAGDSYIIENSYNSGEVTVTEKFEGFAGAIAGDHCTNVLAVTPSPNIENVYYINSVLYASYVNGFAPDEDSFDNAKLLTEEEFKMQSSFVGFNFEEIWEMEENGYPVLKNQPAIPENIPHSPSTGTTESTAESTTESTTEPTTEPSTEPSINPVEDECWLIRAIKWLFNIAWNIVAFVVGLF